MINFITKYIHRWRILESLTPLARAHKSDAQHGTQSSLCCCFHDFSAGASVLSFYKANEVNIIRKIWKINLIKQFSARKCIRTISDIADHR